MARILLVEDDPDVRPLLEHILTTEGYNVTSVETHANAAMLLATQPFDLVVTDANLPDGSGLGVADKAKEIGVPALVITGYGLSLKPGSLVPYEYLLKPVRAVTLLEAIRRLLSRDQGQVIPFPKS